MEISNPCSQCYLRVTEQVQRHSLENVLAFWYILREGCCDLCAFAGSAPLCHFLLNYKVCKHCLPQMSRDFERIKRHAKNNDFDLFIPEFPERFLDEITGLEEYYPYGFQSVSDIIMTAVCEYNQACLQEDQTLEEKDQLVLRSHKVFRKSCPGEEIFDQDNPEYGTFRHIGSITELVFRGKPETPPVQIISYRPLKAFIEAMKKSLVPSRQHPNHIWSRIVTETFDIDVCKTFVDMETNERPIIQFASETGRASLYAGQFIFKVRLFAGFQSVLKRMTKYVAEKRFRLANIEFEKGMTDEWQEYILDNFRHLHLGYWIDEMTAIDQTTKRGIPEFLRIAAQDSPQILQTIKSFAFPNLFVTSDMYWQQLNALPLEVAMEEDSMRMQESADDNDSLQDDIDSQDSVDGYRVIIISDDEETSM